jgi:MFS family permease
MAAGTQAVNQSWRWSYHTLSIFTAILFVLFAVAYEETKFSKVVNGIETPNETTNNDNPSVQDSPKGDAVNDSKIMMSENQISLGPSTRHRELDYTRPMNSWRTRLALSTTTSESIWPHYYRPFYILFCFPTVLFTGLQYASGVVWLTMTASVLAQVFPLPPYGFNSAQIGYLSVGPFIGNLLGAFYGGYLGDRSILYFARRNKGYFEPEMRLYNLHIPAVCLCGGLIMFGVTISRVR